MMAPAFGWSAGDIVQSIVIITKICKAFQENGGAASKYAEATAFLECLKSTLILIKDYAGSNAKYTSAMNEQIKLAAAPYSRFESHMLKYYPVLGANSTQTRFQKIPRKFVWAVKELSEVSGKVAELKKEIAEPFILVGILLQLHSLYVSFLSISNICLLGECEEMPLELFLPRFQDYLILLNSRP